MTVGRARWIALAFACGLGLVSVAAAVPVGGGSDSRVARRATKAATGGAKAAPNRPSPSYAERPEVRDFIDELVADDGFDRDDLLRLFADAHYSDTAARLMTPAATTGLRRDWNVYRARFVEPIRLAAGFRFWEDNATALARAEHDFGVPAEIIVGILGCETVFGRITGHFRVIDALSTLSFDYPNTARDRSAFFREQLTDALLMQRDGLVDLATLRGSYAGAIGMPQFMPGSIRRFAIDYDGDGRVDLVGSAADVIGSVANFLAQHGWVRDLAVDVPLAQPSPIDDRQATQVDAMVAAGSEPSLDFSELTDAGFVAAAIPPPGKLALIDLPAGVDANGVPQTSYIAGTRNFHVLTRYNRSYFYALSVVELGSTIKALRDAER